ncbi:chorismate--pyruvate lyase family protein [Methylomagnum ishizawai]|uniref:chorismate--pyruvate lyase family protein n=1 Tax=Methylomagnum ishizawai TaxID=1760988 RepID=UPI001C333BF5|nr:chorismate lyase [Methylomagnum ishizawai]BBL75773.1 putative chorismate pyruvate-lyase [Methylomagnum ishizawai]
MPLTTSSPLFTRPPVWRPVRPGQSHHIPPGAESWLFEQGSLTLRLRALCGPEFRVRLLRQDWAQPYADEARALGIPQLRRAVVREVLLQCGGRPLVAARSVIPADTLRGAGHALARLGTRPLGEILFRDPRLERTHLELTALEPRLWRRELAATLGLAGKIRGRRSCYRIGPGRLLVAEFFLPALFALEQKS